MSIMNTLAARISGQPDEPAKPRLTDEGFLILQSCRGACDQGRKACASPNICSQSVEDEARLGEIVVLYVSFTAAIGVTACLMLGWI